MKLFVVCLAFVPFFVWSQERSLPEIAESYRNISFAEKTAYSSIEAELENFSTELSIYKKNCADVKHVGHVEKEYIKLLGLARYFNEWNPFFDESFSKKEELSPQEKYIVSVVKMMPLLVVMWPQKNLAVPNISVLRSNLYDYVSGRKISKAKLQQYRKEIEGLEKNLSLNNLEDTTLLPDGKSLEWLNARIEGTNVLLKSFFEFQRLLDAKDCNYEKIFNKKLPNLRFNSETIISSLHSLHIEMARQRISLARAHKEIWQALDRAKVDKNPSYCDENMPSVEGAAFVLPVNNLTDYKYQPLTALSYLSGDVLLPYLRLNTFSRFPSDVYGTACNRLDVLMEIEKKLNNKEKLSSSDIEKLNQSRVWVKAWDEERRGYFESLKLTLDNHLKINKWLNEKSRRQQVRAKFAQKLKEDNRFSAARLEIVLSNYDTFVKEFPGIIEQEKNWVNSFEEKVNVLSKKVSELLSSVSPH